MLPAIIRGKKHRVGDLVRVATSRNTSEIGMLEEYNSEDDEVLIRFTPSGDNEWFSLDPNLDDVRFI